ncbi:ABC transporter permease [Lacibacterium aquatile]|uniref:ABC transporter permease n=1 Tax=Lacibacterium aquatile TaxID=1168082 RepID=A0ABW5DW16_9PROT
MQMVNIIATFGWDLLKGLWLTVQLVVIAAIFGFVLAVPIGVARLSKNPLIAVPAYIYTLVFRGSPLFVQIFLIYYGLGQFTWMRESFLWTLFREAYFCALFAFSLNTAGYMAELIRGGIKAVPHGEREAAVASGMSPMVMYKRILIPRAIRLSLPALSNEVILLMKSTVLASAITMLDLMGTAKNIYTRTYDTTPLYLVAVIYLVLVWIIGMVFKRLEKRYNKFQYVRL